MGSKKHVLREDGAQNDILRSLIEGMFKHHFSHFLAPSSHKMLLFDKRSSPKNVFSMLFARVFAIGRLAEIEKSIVLHVNLRLF